MANLSKEFNGEVLEYEKTSDKAKEIMADRLGDVDGATRLYAETLLEQIDEIREIPPEDKSASDREALLKYLKELEGILGVKNNVGYNYTPVEAKTIEDDLSG